MSLQTDGHLISACHSRRRNAAAAKTQTNAITIQSRLVQSLDNVPCPLVELQAMPDPDRDMLYGAAYKRRRNTLASRNSVFAMHVVLSHSPSLHARRRSQPCAELAYRIIIIIICITPPYLLNGRLSGSGRHRSINSASAIHPRAAPAVAAAAAGGVAVVER